MTKQVLMVMIPELTLLAILCLMVFCDAFTSKQNTRIDTKLHWINYILAFVGLAFSGYYSTLLQVDQTITALGLLFNQTTAELKAVICVISVVVLFYSKHYLQSRKLFQGVYFILFVFSVLGMLLLTSSNNFLTMYLSIELCSLPIYALIALYYRSYAALEAALKYFLMGAVASALLLYGVSLLYGASGNITFEAIPVALVNIIILKLSLVFVLAGLFFKLGLVPFHMWLPDVYMGAPTSVVALIATIPKIAIAIVLCRFLFGVYHNLFLDWQNIITILALISIGFGNLIAIVQNDLKRMLAYSTIANIGFAVLGFLSNQDAGTYAVMFYIIAYALMYLGIFGLLLLLSKNDCAFEELADFNGLWNYQPLIAIILLIFFFALVGVPPFAGFWAKFLVLRNLFNEGLIWPAGLAAAFSVLGVFYCLRLVKTIFFNIDSQSNLQLKISFSDSLVLTINTCIIMFLGLILGF